MCYRLKKLNANTNLCKCVTNFLTSCTPSGNLRAVASSRATVSSAVASVSTSGVYPTRMPLSGTNGPADQELRPTGPRLIFTKYDLPFLDFVKGQVVKSHRQSADHFQVWAWNQIHTSRHYYVRLLLFIS